MGHCFRVLSGLPSLPSISVPTSWVGLGWAGLLSNRRTGLLSWPRPWPQTQGQYPLEISTVPSPSPKPQASVASPFLLLHSKAGCMYGWGGTLGSSAEEGGSGVWTGRHLVFQAVVGGDLPHRFLASFLGSRPAGGASGIRVHSSHCHRLSYVASRPDSCPVITNGALCSQDKERIPYPNLARAGLACPDLGLRRCHFQEEALRRRDGRVCPAGGGICLLVWGVGGGGGVGGVGW